MHWDERAIYLAGLAQLLRLRNGDAPEPSAANSSSVNTLGTEVTATSDALAEIGVPTTVLEVGA